MPLQEVTISPEPRPPPQTVPLGSAGPGEEGWLVDVYYSSVRMSPYLVAVVVITDHDAVESDPVDGGPLTKVATMTSSHA
jgi:hypothetical protein